MSRLVGNIACLASTKGNLLNSSMISDGCNLELDKQKRIGRAVARVRKEMECSRKASEMMSKLGLLLLEKLTVIC